MSDPGLKRTAQRADALTTMKALLALTVLTLPLLLALGNGQHTMSRSDVSRALAAQMNGTAAGHITERVGCSRLAGAKAGSPARFSCVLVGRRVSTHAVVTVTGDSWRAEWAPLRG